MSAAFESLICKTPEMFDRGLAARTMETIAGHAGQGAGYALFEAAASNSSYLARTLVQECAFLPEILANTPGDTFGGSTPLSRMWSM